MDCKHKGILYSISASVLFGLSPVFVRLMLDSVNIETLNALLTVFSTSFFAVMLFLSKRSLHFKVILRNWRKVGLLGLVTAMFALLYVYGIYVSGPTNAAFLLQFATVFTILFGVVFLKERFTKGEGWGIVVAVVGVFVLAYGNLSVEVVGTLIFLCASLLVALSNLLSKIYVKDVNPLALAGGNSMFVSVFIFSYVLLFGKLEVNIPSEAVVYAALASLVSVVFSFILLYKALEVYEVSKTATIRTMEPFFTAIFSFAILSLSPTINQLSGGFLIVIGVVILSLTRTRCTSSRD